MTEAELRLLFHIAICTALHAVIKEIWHLKCILIESDRQTTRGIVVAKECLSYCLTTHLTGIEHLHHSITVLCFRNHSHCRS